MAKIITHLTTQLPFLSSLPIKYTLWHLRGNVYRVGDSLELGNMLICNALEGLTIVDAKLDACFPALYNFIQEHFQKPVTRLINTHCHPDHAGGNLGFCAHDRPQIIAHKRCAQRLAQNQQLAVLNEFFPALPQIARPDTLVENTFTINLTEESITLEKMNGHTDNDLVVFCHKADVLHTGDLCSFGGFPYIGINEGGNVYNMLNSLNRLEERVGSETIIVPGHGEHNDKHVLHRYINMLDTAVSNVKALVEKGAKLADVIKARPCADMAATCKTGVGPLIERTFVEVLYLAVSDTEKF